MIINIPLQIDEQKMEEVIQRDYEGKIFDEIMKQIRTTLAEKSDSCYGDKVKNGLMGVVKAQVDKFLNDHADDVIERASSLMAEKLARSKRGKEILENAR